MLPMRMTHLLFAMSMSMTYQSFSSKSKKPTRKACSVINYSDQILNIVNYIKNQRHEFKLNATKKKKRKHARKRRQ